MLFHSEKAEYSSAAASETFIKAPALFIEAHPILKIHQLCYEARRTITHLMKRELNHQKSISAGAKDKYPELRSGSCIFHDSYIILGGSSLLNALSKLQWPGWKMSGRTGGTETFRATEPPRSKVQLSQLTETYSLKQKLKFNVKFSHVVFWWWWWRALSTLNPLESPEGTHKSPQWQEDHWSLSSLLHDLKNHFQNS